MKIRANGKYYQIGYHENSKWINLEQIGTAEKTLELVRLAKWVKKFNIPLYETYQKTINKNDTKNAETYQHKTSQENDTSFD